MKLHDFAIEKLAAALRPKEMLAIYLMGSGSVVTENVTKLDLTNIIFVLCKTLSWVVDDDKNFVMPGEGLSAEKNTEDTTNTISKQSKVSQPVLVERENNQLEESLDHPEKSDRVDQTVEKNNIYSSTGEQEDSAKNEGMNTLSVVEDKCTTAIGNLSSTLKGFQGWDANHSQHWKEDEMEMKNQIDSSETPDDQSEELRDGTETSVSADTLSAEVSVNDQSEDDIDKQDTGGSGDEKEKDTTHSSVCVKSPGVIINSSMSLRSLDNNHVVPFQIKEEAITETSNFNKENPAMALTKFHGWKPEDLSESGNKNRSLILKVSELDYDDMANSDSEYFDQTSSDYYQPDLTIKTEKIENNLSSLCDEIIGEQDVRSGYEMQNICHVNNDQTKDISESEDDYDSQIITVDASNCSVQSESEEIHETLMEQNGTDDKEEWPKTTLKNSVDNQPWKCVHCGRTYVNKHTLKKHVFWAHTNKEKLKCKHCDRTYTTQETLRVHLLSAHSGKPRERPFGCDQCGKAFVTRQMLTRHQRTHNGEKPFACGVCNRRFSLQGDRNRHEKTHTDQRDFECATCGGKFARKATLQKHERIHKISMKNPQKEI